MVKTNPIPLNGVPSIYQYLSQLRYPHISTKGICLSSVQYKRTSEWDDTDLKPSINDYSGVSTAFL